MTLSQPAPTGCTRELPDEHRPPGPDPHHPGGDLPPAPDRRDVVGPAPVPGGDGLGDDAGRLHLAAADVPAGPAREPPGPGRGVADARHAASADPPPVGGDRHHRPACRPDDGPGAVRGDLGRAAAAGVGGRSPRRRREGRGRLGAHGAGRTGRPRRPAGALRVRRPEVGVRPCRQRGRHVGPPSPGRDPLRHPVCQGRIGGERRSAFRPAPGGRARRDLRPPGRDRPFGPSRWVSA